MQIRLQPSGIEFTASPEQNLLEGARQAGLPVCEPCADQRCENCCALMLQGDLMPGSELPHRAEIRTCLARPHGNCELFWEMAQTPDTPQRLLCTLLECQDVGGDVYRLRLAPPAQSPVYYHAGQYLLLEREGASPTALSIASAPSRHNDIELHLLAREPRQKQLIDALRRRKCAWLRLPFGDAHLEDLPNGPLVLLAAGTGMAQMQSLLEECAARGFSHPVHLYWGVRQSTDFYNLPHWPNWEALPHLHLHKVVSDDANWQGRHGLLHEALCQDFPDLSGLHVYASGSPGMIYATLDALVEAGMQTTQMRADAFAYAPRT